MSGGKIDIETIRQFKADDRKAFNAIYRAFRRRIFRFAYSYVKIQADAEEIVQDVFLKIWENREKIDESLSFESFLFTITYNTSISQLRKKVSENQYVEYLKSIQRISTEVSTSPEIEFTELKDNAEQIIEQLPPRQKQIFKLNREEGLTYREIASMLNISQNTVESHMERALKTIRKKLGNISVAVLIFYYLFI
ncbi:MAG: RNA polymerase sigma-70 factor [Bacteroidota bacterium]